MSSTCVHGQSILDHILIEQRRFSRTEDKHQYIQRCLVCVVQVYGGIGNEYQWQRNIIFHRQVSVGIERNRRNFRVGDRRAARYRCEVLIDPGERLRFVKFAADRQRGVVRPIPTQEKLLEVDNVNPIQIFDIADRQPGVSL